MKHLLICLYVGCLMSPAWSQEHDMSLEKFVQKLENTKPWTRENVEAQLGVKLTETSSKDSPFNRYIHHTASGQFVYRKDLIIREITLSASSVTNETSFLGVNFDDSSSCVTVKQIKELYPNIYKDEDEFLNAIYGGFLYTREQSWGKLQFVFGDGREMKCVTSILVSPDWREQKEQRGQQNMKQLKEFVQKLEDVKPLTLEKVEEQLGVKLALSQSTSVSTWYKAEGQFIYGKGVIVNRVLLQVSKATNESLSLMASFYDPQSCYTQEQIEKSYPDGFIEPIDMEERYYAKKRPWGILSFGFMGWDKKDCMNSIAIKTNALLESKKPFENP